MEEKGVFPILLGGLGNQMFVMSAGYVISQTKKCPLYLTKNHNQPNHHNIFQLDYKKSIFKYFGTHLDMTENEFLENEKYTKFNPGGFHPYDPSSCSIGNTLDSYFQYYPPLAPFETEIRQKFCQGLEDYFDTSQDFDKNTTAFLHIRRGDYLSIPHVLYIQPITYYEKGVDLLLEQNPSITKINVFSDDIEWAKQQPFFQKPIFQFIDEPNELKALALMSQCKGGAVCANSTFSWWGAFLGSYEQRNPVIVPKRWICDPIYELFPKEWIVI